MSALDCPRETAVVNAVLSGSWPHGCDESLVAHAKDCPTCREVASVSILLREDSEYSRIEAHIPAAGQVWWRAAVRARLESSRAAARPMTWMHGITAAIVIGVVLAAVTALWPVLPGALATAWSFATDLFPNSQVATAIGDGLRMSLLLGLIGAALMLLAPLALYFVLSDD
jgi:Sec-independent protein secretion pathway component TatC